MSNFLLISIFILGLSYSASALNCYKGFKIYDNKVVLDMIVEGVCTDDSCLAANVSISGGDYDKNKILLLKTCAKDYNSVLSNLIGTLSRDEVYKTTVPEADRIKYETAIKVAKDTTSGKGSCAPDVTLNACECNSNLCNASTAVRKFSIMFRSELNRGWFIRLMWPFSSICMAVLALCTNALSCKNLWQGWYIGRKCSKRIFRNVQSDLVCYHGYKFLYDNYVIDRIKKINCSHTQICAASNISISVGDDYNSNKILLLKSCTSPGENGYNQLFNSFWGKLSSEEKFKDITSINKTVIETNILKTKTIVSSNNEKKCIAEAIVNYCECNQILCNASINAKYSIFIFLIMVLVVIYY
ncbi:hypothetical protein A3Q56_01369 [Intoshia linei]|uniref:Uncharacterized protein n=1 Tax=Intoshia linei TaxID=1819745 RepID=A0A177BB42_9BILA|nr:hypothetical protein A3Q56_01369 [Intoshia linei]